MSVFLGGLVFSSTFHSNVSAQRGRPPVARPQPQQQRPTFKPYTNPKPTIQQHAVQVHEHVDAHQNRVTDDHLQRVQLAKERTARVTREQPHYREVIQARSVVYRRDARPIFEHRVEIFKNYRSDFERIRRADPRHLNRWREVHFYPGFEYGTQAWLDVDTDLGDPNVQWCLDTTFDAGFYQTYYESEFTKHKYLQQAFPYAGTWTPTESLHQLLNGVSGMTPDKQSHFHRGLILMTEVLAQKLGTQANQLAVELDHYEVLNLDDGLTLVGVVSLNNQPFSFQGVINLDHPHSSDVFVTSFDTDLNNDQIGALNRVNATIDSLRGISVEGEPIGPDAPINN